MNAKSAKELRLIAKGIARLHNAPTETNYTIYRSREIRLAECEKAIYRALKKEQKRLGGTTFKTSAQDRFRDSQERGDQEHDSVPLSDARRCD